MLAFRTYVYRSSSRRIWSHMMGVGLHPYCPCLLFQQRQSSRHLFLQQPQSQTRWLAMAMTDSTEEQSTIPNSTTTTNSSIRKLDDARRRKQSLRQRHRQRHRNNIDEQKPSDPILVHDKVALEEYFDQLSRKYHVGTLLEALKRIETALRTTSSSKSNAWLVLNGMLQSTNPNMAAQVELLEFILGTSKRTNVPKEKDVAVDDAVDVFVLARQWSLEQGGLFWGSNDRTLGLAKNKSALAELVQQRQAVHAQNSDSHRDEARALVLFLHSSVPYRIYQSIRGLFAKYVQQSAASKKDPSLKRLVMRKVGTRLHTAAGDYYGIVADQVASFFYLTLDRENVVSQDFGKAQSTKKWNKTKEAFVTGMEKLQAKVATDGTEVASENEEILAIEKKFQTDSQIIRPVKKEPKKRHVHFVFEAMAIHEASNGQAEANNLAAERLVFLDNLPIDCTVEELTELYSRCGAIESIQIMNQRPDLDPGPLTQSQLAARRKLLMRRACPKRTNWQRPRTPVYALVKFRDHDGYRACVVDSLRIFGMIIRRHPVRSIRASDMTKLYVTGVPEDVPCLTMEYELSELLQPNLFVSLDSGQNNRALVGSFEIQFPSFKDAFESFPTLHELDLIKDHDDCRVDWMRNPKDADLWWTRKKGFD